MKDKWFLFPFNQ